MSPVIPGVLLGLLIGVLQAEQASALAQGNEAAKSPAALVALANRLVAEPTVDHCRALVVAVHAVPTNRYKAHPSDDDAVTWRFAEVAHACETARANPELPADGFWLLVDAQIGTCDDAALDRVIGTLETVLLGERQDCQDALAALQLVEVRQNAVAETPGVGPLKPCGMPLEVLRHLAAGGTGEGPRAEQQRKLAVRVLDSIDRRQRKYGYVVPSTLGPVVVGDGLGQGGNGDPTVLKSLDAPEQNLSPLTAVQRETATSIGAAKRTLATVDGLCRTFLAHERDATQLRTKSIPEQLQRWTLTGGWVTRTVYGTSGSRTNTNDQHVRLIGLLDDYDQEINATDLDIAALARQRTNLVVHRAAMADLAGRVGHMAESEPLLLNTAVELRTLGDQLGVAHATTVTTIDAQQAVQKERREWIRKQRDSVLRQRRP